VTPAWADVPGPRGRDRLLEPRRRFRAAAFAREISPNPTERLGFDRPVIRHDEHRQILAKVEAAWREGLRLHPQGACLPRPDPSRSRTAPCSGATWSGGACSRPSLLSGAPSSPTRASAPSTPRNRPPRGAHGLRPDHMTTVRSSHRTGSPWATPGGSARPAVDTDRSYAPQRGQARPSRPSTRRIRAAQVHALGVPAARWAPALLVARAALS